MNIIRLDSGQSFEVPIQGFEAHIEFDLTGGTGFEIDRIPMDHNRRGKVLALRNPIGNSEISIKPDHTRSEFPSDTQLFVSVSLQNATGEEIRLDLPTFDIGGLRTFPVLGIFTTFEKVRLQAGDANTDSSLDVFSSAVRSALRRTLDLDGVAEPPRTAVTVLVDISASMKFSTSHDVFDAMCAFATGVLSTASQGSSIRLLTSSSSRLMEMLESPEAIRALSSRITPAREVGWNVDLAQIDPEDAVLVLSDDLPIEVVNLPNKKVHLLSSRKPLVDHGISVTHVDAKLIEALKVQDLKKLAIPARAMFDALTGWTPPPAPDLENQQLATEKKSS
ncbi:hypothetical protein [Corynebacterium callunae]|uniref:hypothetical protein n=1 Tax=Corynebacterium callunae TaxID=1721 RepID=UPI0020000764|nr:hypothetical protein [Corynebacterium callunae]MCK2199997.1 hypothetical protein [Corynebacterium callunae]